MTHSKRSAISLAALFAVMLGSGCATLNPTPIEYLQKDPPLGNLPHGKVVYVDDGQCPAGKVKKLIGGDAKQNIPRHVECVDRPQ